MTKQSGKSIIKKRDKENKKENFEVIQDQKASVNTINGSTREDTDEQKKRKRKRKRRHNKDLELPDQTNRENHDQETFTYSKKTDLSSSMDKENVTSSIVNSDASKKEITNTESVVKKDKAVKPRTKASAKKTIEGLKTINKKATESDDIIEDTKLGKKGWWDR